MELKSFINELNKTISSITKIKSSRISKVSKNLIADNNNYFQLKIETEMFVPTFEQIKIYTNGYLKLNTMIKDSDINFQVDNNEDKPIFNIISTNKNSLKTIQDGLKVPIENKENKE